jgi:tripartite-type tricarboxylate transporter receptor subunit TctC
MGGSVIRTGIVCALAGALVCAAVRPATAQTYPSRPIELVVPLAPGSTTDVLARLLAQRVSQTLGAQVVIDNKPGAGSMLGSAAVAKAAPDGYTLLLGAIGLAINPLLYPNVPYDTARDFAPISLLVTAPMILLANPALGVNSLRDFLVKYKDSKDLSYGSPGPGTLPQLTAELVKFKSGIAIRHVPYRGGAPALNDTIAGHVQLTVGTPVTKPVIDAGKVVALAIAAPQRIETLPNVPTFAEEGLAIPELDGGAWFALLAPAGTPKDVVAKLAQHFNDALRHPPVREQLAQAGLVAKGTSPEDFTHFLHEEIERWPPIFARAGIGRVGEAR